MISVSFYILSSSLPPPRIGNRHYGGLAMDLLEGDAKNDRQPRTIQRIVVSDQEQKLVSHLASSHGAAPTDVIAILGFTHQYAADIKSIASKTGASLCVINAPARRHPAALVAIADRVMRVRSHHLFHSDYGGGGYCKYTFCNLFAEACI